MNEISIRVKEYLVENFLLGEDTGIDPEQSLLASGTIDSTGVLELVTFLEETYHIAIRDEEMLPENLDSVANIGRFVERKLAERTVAAAGA